MRFSVVISKGFAFVIPEGITLAIIIPNGIPFAGCHSRRESAFAPLADRFIATK